MGNIGSMVNMLKKVGVPADQIEISESPTEINRAKKLILPGVGAFDTGMRNLQERNLIGVLNKKVLEEKVPVLGVCIGIQLMTQKSQEGRLAGLGWIEAETVRFNTEKKVPHMGWNKICAKKKHPLLDHMRDDARFYFVHSYHLNCDNEEDVLAKTEYDYPFVSAVQKNNIMGVQFHPEKSHAFGMQLLKNFANLP